MNSIRLAAALLLVAGTAQAQTSVRADSTVCVAFRVITRSSGAIYTTSVNKVVCGGKRDTIRVLRVDTLKQTIHDTLPGRVDTLFREPTPAPVPLDPRGYNCWQRRDATNIVCLTDAEAVPASQVTVLRAYGQTFGYVRWMWKGVIYPTDPSLPVSGTVRVDTVTVTKRDTVTIIRKDTVLVIRVDTVKVPVVTPPPTSSRTPELPRVSVDTRMPDMPMSGDTLYQVNGVWWCRGPTCSQTLMSHGLPPLQSTPIPPATLPWILAGKPSP